MNTDPFPLWLIIFKLHYNFLPITILLPGSPPEATGMNSEKLLIRGVLGCQPSYYDLAEVGPSYVVLLLDRREHGLPV